ncbi:MAG: glutamate racemase [Cyanobacteria bacterium SIG28]|nr:glutamate racemase [Cyanobacteria bacterium SIG28]
MREEISNKNLPIGFFDSGVGGLSVFARFRELLSNENTIYYGDLKNLPYGNKSQEELIGFAKNILDFFKSKNVKAVVIACNTSSALAYNAIKSDYDFQIYPIIQSCAKVISELNYTRIGVFATQGTVKSGAYGNELRKYNSDVKVCEIACPNWVSIVEGLDCVSKDDDVKQHVDEMLNFNPEKIILGCTHYPYLLKTIEKYAPKNLFIDPASIFAEFIKKDLKQQNLINDCGLKGFEEFYVSANPKEFVKNAQLFYEIKKEPIIA